MRVALSEVLGALSYALDITEGEPPGHAVRTTAIGMRLAEHLGLSQDERSALFYALLLKAAGCSSNASCLSSLFAAAEIARMLELPEDTAQAIRALDEHWDGGGQPLGLRGDEIPLFARVIDDKSPFTARRGRPLGGRRRRARDCGGRRRCVGRRRLATRIGRRCACQSACSPACVSARAPTGSRSSSPTTPA